MAYSTGHDNREPSLLKSVSLFWMTLLALWLGPMFIESMRLGAEQADRQGFGMSAFILAVMSVPAALTHLATLAIVNGWRERTARRPLTVAWLPVVSALMVAGLGYTALPRVIYKASEGVFGPSTEWGYLTLPVALTVIASELAMTLATPVHRSAKRGVPVGP